MPIVSQIKDPVRQTYYLDKLAGLVETKPEKARTVIYKKQRLAQRTKSLTAGGQESSSFQPG